MFSFDTEHKLKKKKKKPVSNLHCITHVTAILVIAIPVAILIQLLTLVYSIVLPEDSGGCKLYL